MSPFNGVYVANLTPFAPDGAICLESFKAHCQFLKEQGVAGFVPCGTTGEGPTVSEKERIALLEVAREVASAGETPLQVIAGCGGNSTCGVVEKVKAAESTGCDGTLVVTPYYNKPTQEGLFRHFMEVADNAQKPLVVYHTPPRSGVRIEPETLMRIFEHPNIVAIKEATGEYRSFLAASQILDPAKHALLAGDDDVFAAILSLGGSGIISASANAIPKAFVQIQASAQSGDWERAYRIQTRILPAVRAFFSETNPGPLKFALNEMDFMENSVRLPLVPVWPETEEWVRAALVDYQKVLESDL